MERLREEMRRVTLFEEYFEVSYIIIKKTMVLF